VIIPVHGLVCLNGRDGSKVWELRGGVNASRPVIVDGSLYATWPQYPRNDPSALTFIPSFVKADAATGRITWEQKFVTEVRGDPLVTGRSIYIVQWDGLLCCLDRESGKIRWKLDVGLGQWAPTPLAHEGRLLLCFKNKIVCVAEFDP
jgi:outer membrane protein assembly factor BamB